MNRKQIVRLIIAAIVYTSVWIAAAFVSTLLPKWIDLLVFLALMAWGIYRGTILIDRIFERDYFQYDEYEEL